MPDHLGNFNAGRRSSLHPWREQLVWLRRRCELPERAAHRWRLTRAIRGRVGWVFFNFNIVEEVQVGGLALQPSTADSPAGGEHDHQVGGNKYLPGS